MNGNRTEYFGFLVLLMIIGLKDIDLLF